MASDFIPYHFNPYHFNEFPMGVYTVLVTPFNEDGGSVLYDEITNWINEQLSSNIVGIVIHGTTSESPTLSKLERITIARHVVKEYERYYSEHPDIPKKMIIIGTGTNCTQSTIDNCLEMRDLCHAFMIVMPYYNKPQQRGLVEHFKTISHHQGLANKMILLYNVPGRTGINCLPETVKEIVDVCPNVKGLKEACGNPVQVKNIIDLCKNTGLKVFSGDDKIIVQMLEAGSVGLISVASNVFPKPFTEIVSRYLDCDGENKHLSQIIYDAHYIGELCDALFCESNPVPVKRMMKLSGRYKFDSLRLPLVQLDPKYDAFVSQTYEKVRVSFV